MGTSWQTKLDLPKECEYIIAKSLAGENVIVILGALVLLSYASGDAYILDIEDKYACELCADGRKRRYPLFDAGTTWAFKWPWRYSLAKGRVYFERIDGGDSSGLPSMIARGIERAVTQHNRKAGTNYHL
jgi:hypothetical protein